MRRHSLAAGLVFALALTPGVTRALTIIPTWDPTITNDPNAATIESTINSAIALYNAKLLDNITVNVTFQQVTSGLGASSTQRFSAPYYNYLYLLHSHASSLDDAVALSHLPNSTTDPVIGSTTILVRSALVRALGLVSGVGPNQAVTPAEPDLTVLDPAPGDPRARGYDREAFKAMLRRTAARPLAADQIPSDATVSLNIGSCNLSAAQNDPTKYSLFSVVCHELDEVLGNASNLNNLANGAPAPTNAIEVTDLYRYAANGVRSFNTTANTVAYFSLDGFITLARFNQNAQGDFSDFYSPGGQTPQVQDAFGTQGSSPVPNVEWRLLDVYGWKLAPFAYWVDFNFSNPVRNGSWANPFNSLTEAVNAVPVGSTIMIVGGSHSLELLTLSKPLTITSVSGTTVIGQ